MKLEVFTAPAITALCLISHIPVAEATAYYLSSSQGSDTNAGTSESAPWMSCSNVTRQAIFGKFTGGDSILLKAGDTFEGPLQINSSGTQSSPITVGPYGSGANPIIYGDHPSATWSLVNGHPGVYSTYIWSAGTIQAVYDVNGGYYARLSRGTNTLDAWLSTFTTNKWGIDSGRVFICTPDGNAPPQMHLFEWAAVSLSRAYITLHDLEICNGSFGIAAGSYPGIISRNNSIHDTLNIGIYYGGWATVGEISSNIVTRSGETSIYLSECGGVWAHHNTCSYSGSNSSGVYILKCHVPAGEQCGIGMERGTNNIVEYNSISYTYGSIFDYWLEQGTVVRYNYGFHSGGAAYPDGTGLKLYCNIFNIDGAGPGINASYDYNSSPGYSAGPNLGTNLVFNNILYNFKTYGFYGISGQSNVVYRNNILITPSTTSCMAQLGSGSDCDYNLYYCTGGTAAGWSWNNININCSTLATWKTASGLDSHSISANPQFVSLNPVAAADFKLKSTSPCVDVGQNLKAVGLLPSTQQYQDFLGTLIPQGAGPDIGAYELGGLSPASDLHVVPK